MSHAADDKRWAILPPPSDKSSAISEDLHVDPNAGQLGRARRQQRGETATSSVRRRVRISSDPIASSDLLRSSNTLATETDLAPSASVPALAPTSEAVAHSPSAGGSAMAIPDATLAPNADHEDDEARSSVRDLEPDSRELLTLGPNPRNTVPGTSAPNELTEDELAEASSPSDTVPAPSWLDELD